jgi:hypothetical protein
VLTEIGGEWTIIKQTDLGISEQKWKPKFNSFRPDTAWKLFSKE